MSVGMVGCREMIEKTRTEMDIEPNGRVVMVYEAIEKKHTVNSMIL